MPSSQAEPYVCVGMYFNPAYMSISLSYNSYFCEINTNLLFTQYLLFLFFFITS